MKLRILALLTALLLIVLPLASCKKQAETPADGSQSSADEKTTVRIYSLNGTTGFGMAKLMEDAASDSFEKESYTVTVKTDPVEVRTALINGDVDIAALPTNLASTVYNVSEGAIKILAVNTLGCLYLLTNNGTQIYSFADLAGKTVYAPAQNPTMIFKHLCAMNGVNVEIKNDYAEAAALQARFAQGATVAGGSDEVSIVVLPEPAVTAVTAAAKGNGVTVTNLMDLTAEWDKLEGHAGTLVQGCVVVRKAFLEAHPETVERFLTAYKASVEYVNTNVSEAAQLIEKHGLFAKAAVAEKAIPKCNIAYLDGNEMKQAMTAYLTVLQGINANAIGGKLPDDNFYYQK